MEGRPWITTLPFAERVDVESSIFGAWVYCLAVEKLAEVEIPERAKIIRIIVGELNRISCHLNSLVRLAKSMNAEVVQHHILRDREVILDLFELLTGARFNYSYLRFGGVVSDITEGFIDRLDRVCRDLLPRRVKEYNDLFSFNVSFRDRAEEIGRVSSEQVLGAHLTGPNARASGATLDLRVDDPFGGYESFDLKPIKPEDSTKNASTVHDRLIYRLKEIGLSAEVIKEAINKLPEGEFKAPIDLESLPKGEAMARVESSRGVLSCHLISEGKAPSRVSFSPSSLSTLGGLHQLIQGARVEDLGPILASLDISVSEVDR